MTAQLVHELELPLLQTIGMERLDAIAAVEEARARHWLARTDMGYCVTRLEDVTAILRDKRFHSALSILPQMAGMPELEEPSQRRKSILSMEGEEHARLRRLVAPAFTPLSANRLRPTMRAVLGHLVDRAVADGECEFVSAVCEPYPIPIICELLGTPPEDWKLFSSWATDIFRIFNGTLEQDLPLIERASTELTAYVSDMIAERRADPRDDLLSDLIAVEEEEGDRLSTEEMAMLAQAVLMAGTDTTRNQLACSVAVFSEHPEQWRLLAQHPELAPRAVEESLRYLGAVRATVRFAAEEVTYRDVLFPQGTIVSISLAGANRDPELWDRPNEFDITQERGHAQMTFGSGIHFCLGAALARAELQEALPLLARRMPGLARNGPVEWKPANFEIWGPASLPIRFDAA